MESTDEKVQSVRAAIGQISSSTVNTINELLLSNTSKPSAKSYRDAADPTSKSGTHPANLRSRKLLSKTTLKEYHKQLSPKEKLILSTEIINASLKSLNETIKSTSVHPTRQISKDQIKASVRNDLRKSVSFDSSLPSFTPTRRTSSSSNPNFESRPSSLSSGDCMFRPTADAARMAFSCLRTLQSSHAKDVNVPYLQLENGMSVLISKLISLGMNDLAVKELRILKRCLVSDGNQKKEYNSTFSRSAKGVYNPSDLLDFGRAEFTGRKMELVITTQLQILRILSYSKNAKHIESALHILHPSNISSPTRLLLTANENAKESKIKEKLNRQFEILSEILLSLCPSISLSHDTLALEPVLSVAPEIAIQLQSIALQSRFFLWKLNEHKGDLVKDILEPFRRCLMTFIRRSQCSPSETFSIAVEASKIIEKIPNNNSIPHLRGLGVVLVEIFKTLASLAKEASNINAAIKWSNEAYMICKTKDISDLRFYSVIARLVSLRLQLSTRELVEEEQLLSLLENLKSPFKGEPSEIQELLIEVSHVRRAALSLFLQRRKSSEALTNANDGLQEMCVSLIFLCPQLFLRYLGTAPKAGSALKEMDRYEKKRQFITKLSSHAIDSALLLTKILLGKGNLTCELLDSRLHDCLSLLNRTNSDSEEISQYDAKNSPSLSYYVKISNIYYTQFLNIRDSQNNTRISQIIRTLRRSLDCIQNRPFSERKAALFTTKLERLAELYKNLGRYDELVNVLCKLRDEIVGGGVLSHISKRAASLPLNIVWNESREIAMLSRTIHSILKIQVKSKKQISHFSLYESTLSKEDRAIILEHELEILCRKSFPNSNLTTDLQIVIFKELFVLYDPLEYPLRRIRVALKLLSTNCSIFSKELKEIEQELELQAIANLNVQGTEDEKLSAYSTHYKLMIMVCKELDMRQPRLEKITEGLAAWSDIASKCQDFPSLSEKIDDVIGLLGFLQVIADWLHVYGHGAVRVAALRLITNLCEKCDSIINSDELILSISVLGIQWLQLGYSGKAGIAVDRARALHQKHGSSSFVGLQATNVKIQLISHSDENLSHAQALFAQQKEDQQNSNVVVSLEHRTKTNILLSKAYFIYSKIAIERGSFHSALIYAKQCVQLLRYTWASIEDHENRRKQLSIDSPGSEIDKLVREFSQMNLSSSYKSSADLNNTPQEYLSYWTVIIPLFEGLSHLSVIFSHNGMYQETVYYAEQAYKLAKQIKSNILLANSGINLANVLLRGGNLNRGSELLAEANPIFSSLEKNKDTALLAYNLGMMNGLSGEYEAEISAYNDSIFILNKIIGKEYIDSIENISGASGEVFEKEELFSRKKIQKASTPRVTGRSRIATRGKLAIQTKALATNTLSMASECTHISSLRSLVMREKSRVLILQKKWVEALTLLQEVEITFSSVDKVSHGLALGNYLLLQSLNQMDADPVYSILQDSTISFPSVLGNSKLSRFGDKFSATSSSPKKIATMKNSLERSHPRSTSSETFFDKLRRAQECLRETLAIALVVSPVSVIYKTSHLLNSVAVLLSTADQTKGKSITHPGFSSLFVETARNIALRNERTAIQAAPQAKLKLDGSCWPQYNPPENIRPNLEFQDDTLKKFEREYIDIIPKSWTVISISLSESCHELSLIKLQSGNSPFILRLPLGRNSSIDADEEIFDYEQGRSELREIIKLANITAHDAGNRVDKEARLLWWEEREALDTRMKDLLENIQKVWLGGFTGIFSQHTGRPDLLARFQKSFQNILDKYLPSRQKNSKRKSVPRITLDNRILDLFIGLGDVDDGDDLSEPLTDLLYFVVDVLQFHGELNAYAEIDFDMIVLETMDTLRCYHEALRATGQTNKDGHIILILDKSLHSFPWESLPCLDGISVSRLPSLESLKERISIRHENSSINGPDGHYINREKGSYILNPGGDLKHTLGMFQKRLKSLLNWKGITNREPSEDEFKDSLLHSDLFLYFGHGSGSQYIRAREIQKLSQCAVTMLMGCSSGALTEAGEFEPYGPPMNYLHAGSYALVATLWDVTDKDIDRFAISTIENWGLLQPESNLESEMKEDKTFDNMNSKKSNKSLIEAVMKGRKACKLRYLNAAAVCVYGVPVYFKEN